MAESEFEKLLTPQSQANLAAGKESVVITTDNGNFVVLTSDLAISIGHQLPILGKMAKELVDPCVNTNTLS